MINANGPRSGRPAIHAARGMVSSPHYLASASGQDALRRGGSAVDAAIAVNATLCVVYPHMAGLGGDAFWLIAGGLVFCGLAWLFALVNLLRADRKAGRPTLYFLLLLITWGLGLVNAFEHAKDAWAVMPSGLVLSAIVTLLACVTTWVGLTNLRSGGDQ